MKHFAITMQRILPRYRGDAGGDFLGLGSVVSVLDDLPITGLAFGGSVAPFRCCAAVVG